MKYVIMLGDGMADEPVSDLGGKTPLQYARTPNMDRIASEGTLGLINTIPQGFTPGSDVANLAVLGYDPALCYAGRGPLEAASMGIELGPDDVAFRCNLVTLSDGGEPVMADFTSGHISSDEAGQIINDLNQEIGSDEFIFYPGVGYRHLLVWRNGKYALKATPPHDITGKAVELYLPTGEGAEAIRGLMAASGVYLDTHPVNRERIKRGLKPASSVWLWGQGRAPRMEKITDRFGIRGAMISAVDLLNGLGVCAGLEVLKVEGATGYTDTNYIGKAETALEALSDLDFVFIHVEAPDEMGHEGNLHGKIKAIEDFDEKVVGTILNGIRMFREYRVAVLSDHPTPVRLMTHAAEPSPISTLFSLKNQNQARGFSFGEADARRSGITISPGHGFMEDFIRPGRLWFERSAS